MNITFRLYSPIKEIIGDSKVEIFVDSINILYAFVHELQEKYPQYDFSNCIFGRGTKYIDLTTPLKEGDFIFVFPKVATP